MDLRDAANICESIIKRRRTDVLNHMSNILDNEREFDLSIGRLETLKKYLRRVTEIRRQYQELVEEAEEIAEQVNKI